MKKLLFVVAMLAMAGSVMGQSGPPANNSSINAGLEGTTTATVDSQWTGVWYFVDSTIVVMTDTCDTWVQAYGLVTLDPGNKLYIGILAGGTEDGAGVASDTVIVTWPATEPYPTTLPFSILYVGSLRSQTDANDTVYVTMAVKGSSPQEEVDIASFNIRTGVANFDAP